ncbi:MAG: hypothetical protein IKW81_07280 [Pseudobutyrivibrio sp.]|nr:hypothetical protein [Pseudobutyrivibrio sp.]
MDVRKQDWKLFREKLPGWQEKYIERVLNSYVKLLAKPDELASEKFWKLDKKIKSDKRKPGVIMELDKSEMEVDMARLIKDKVITFDDLADFSPELQETVKTYYERFFGKK